MDDGFSIRGNFLVPYHATAIVLYRVRLLLPCARYSSSCEGCEDLSLRRVVIFRYVRHSSIPYSFPICCSSKRYMKYSVVVALHFTSPCMCHAFKWVSDDCCAVFGEEGSQVCGAQMDPCMGAAARYIYWTNSVCCTFPSPATCYFLLKYNFFFLFVFSFDGEMRHGSVRAAQSDALEYVGIEKTHQQQIQNWGGDGKTC